MICSVFSRSIKRSSTSITERGMMFYCFEVNLYLSSCVRSFLLTDWTHSAHLLLANTHSPITGWKKQTEATFPSQWPWTASLLSRKPSLDIMTCCWWAAVTSLPDTWNTFSVFAPKLRPELLPIRLDVNVAGSFLAVTAPAVVPVVMKRPVHQTGPVTVTFPAANTNPDTDSVQTAHLHYWQTV